MEPTRAPQPTATADARIHGWEADLRALVEVRERVHPEPWHGIARDEYVAAVDDVIARIPEMSDNELLVQVTRLAAMPTWAGRDGHGGIYPWGEGTFGTNLFPLRLYWFSDGVYVVDALPPFHELIGQRLDTIEGHPIAQILTAVEPLVPRDNHMQLLTHSMRLVVVAEILDGLGLIDDPAQPVPMEFSDGSETHDVVVSTVPLAVFEAWAGGHHTHSPPARPDGAMWLRDIATEAWWTMERDDTAYISYNFASSAVSAIVNEVEAAIEAGDVERLVVDARHNPGGNNTTFHSLRTLVQKAATDLPGGAYVIFGRATFSAAGNFVTDIDRLTEAVLVGEDSGTSPNQYGDSQATTLGHSGLVYRNGRYWIQRTDPDDPRLTVEPDIETALSAADYFSDRDPALEAILADSP
jgi:hypothetical protein